MADLSRFENGQELPPGTYRVDIYLNNGYMATRDVTFNTGDSEQGIVPCLTRAQLASMGLNTASVAGMNLLADDACVPLTTMVRGRYCAFRCWSAATEPDDPSGIYE